MPGSDGGKEESPRQRKQHDQRKGSMLRRNWGRVSCPICTRCRNIKELKEEEAGNVGWKKTGEVLKALNARRELVQETQCQGQQGAQHPSYLSACLRK